MKTINSILRHFLTASYVLFCLWNVFFPFIAYLLFKYLSDLIGIVFLFLFTLLFCIYGNMLFSNYSRTIKEPYQTIFSIALVLFFIWCILMILFVVHFIIVMRDFKD